MNVSLTMYLHFFWNIKTIQQDCPNGRLTPAKFVDMYKMFFPSGNAEEFCDHVFRTFDMDKNGYIDFKVFTISFCLNKNSKSSKIYKYTSYKYISSYQNI